jgi:hypothetical protein
MRAEWNLSMFWLYAVIYLYRHRMQFHAVGGARSKPYCLFTAAPVVLDQSLLLTAPALAFF